VTIAWGPTQARLEKAVSKHVEERGVVAVDGATFAPAFMAWDQGIG
jgi:hypothetical protein